MNITHTIILLVRRAVSNYSPSETYCTQLHIATSHTDQSGKLKLEECLSSKLDFRPGTGLNTFKANLKICLFYKCHATLTEAALLFRYCAFTGPLSGS